MALGRILLLFQKKRRIVNSPDIRNEQPQKLAIHIVSRYIV